MYKKFSEEELLSVVEANRAYRNTQRVVYEGRDPIEDLVVDEYVSMARLIDIAAVTGCGIQTVDRYVDDTPRAKAIRWRNCNFRAHIPHHGSLDLSAPGTASCDE